MKNLILSILIFNLITSGLSAQNCNKVEGDKYYLKGITANLRQKPNNNSPIIEVLDDKYYNVEITDNDSIINNYIYVKAVKDSNISDTTSMLFPWGTIKEIYGWVNSSLIDFNGDNFSFVRYGESDIDDLDRLIFEELMLKNANSCKYNPSHLAYGYCQKGILIFRDNNYFEAIEWFNKSIDISTPNSLQEKLESYYYKGQCKMKLNDYYGALKDLSHLINQKSRINNYLVYDWQGKYKGQFLSLGLNYPLISKEDVYIKMAICKSYTKDYTGALNDISLILANNNKYGNAYYVRAQIKYYLKNYQGACKDASEAGELGIKEAYDFIGENCK
jgi:hypothetical protein